MFGWSICQACTLCTTQRIGVAQAHPKYYITSQSLPGPFGCADLYIYYILSFLVRHSHIWIFTFKSPSWNVLNWITFTFAQYYGKNAWKFRSTSVVKITGGHMAIVSIVPGAIWPYVVSGFLMSVLDLECLSHVVHRYKICVGLTACCTRQGLLCQCELSI